MRSVVVLPQPDGPKKVMNSPFRTYRLTLSTATVSENTLETFTISMIFSSLLNFFISLSCRILLTYYIVKEGKKQLLFPSFAKI